MAACAVRKITSIRCFSPTEANRVTFATEMSALLGIDVVPVSQPEEAIQGADIVMCASNSLDAIFFERWVSPGVHLSSIKQPEIEAKALLKADRIVLHSHDTTPLIVTTRELALAKKANEHGWSAAKDSA